MILSFLLPHWAIFFIHNTSWGKWQFWLVSQLWFCFVVLYTTVRRCFRLWQWTPSVTRFGVWRKESVVFWFCGDKIGNLTWGQGGSKYQATWHHFSSSYLSFQHTHTHTHTPTPTHTHTHTQKALNYSYWLIYPVVCSLLAYLNSSYELNLPQ